MVAVFAVIYSKTAVSVQLSLLKSYRNLPYIAVVVAAAAVVVVVVVAAVVAAAAAANGNPTTTARTEIQNKSWMAICSSSSHTAEKTQNKNSKVACSAYGKCCSSMFVVSKQPW